MKRSVLSIVSGVLLTAVAATLCTGCDLVRASLGKPTSADLELLRLAEQVRAGSAAKDSAALAAANPAAPAAAETPAAPADAPKADPGVHVAPVVQAPSPSAVPAQVTAANGIKKYYVVVGAFKEDAGIKYYVKELRDKGYEVVLLPFKSGSTTVCLQGTDDIETARTQMRELRAAGIDAWLYASNQKLHKEQ